MAATRLSTASVVVSVRWKLSSPRAASGYCAKGRNAVPHGTANPVLAAMRATLSTEAFSNVGSLDGPARVRHRLASRVCRAGPFRPFEPTRALKLRCSRSPRGCRCLPGAARCSPPVAAPIALLPVNNVPDAAYGRIAAGDATRRALPRSFAAGHGRAVRDVPAVSDRISRRGNHCHTTGEGRLAIEPNRHPGFEPGWVALRVEAQA